MPPKTLKKYIVRLAESISLNAREGTYSYHGRRIMGWVMAYDHAEAYEKMHVKYGVRRVSDNPNSTDLDPLRLEVFLYRGGWPKQKEKADIAGEIV